VVIPAHNEARVIGRCLAALADGATPGELDVIVVANACTDDTAALAGSVRVIETPIAGKARALNLGDARCRAFPRLYLDADIELTAADVRDLVKALSANGVLAAAPTPRFDLTGASWLVRRFHIVLAKLAGDRALLSGAGAYLLSEAAHDRVFPMPEIIADDAFVHRSFTAAERAVVAAVTVTIRPPRTAFALIRRRARVRRGNQDLAARGMPATEPPLSSRELGRMVRQRDVGLFDAGCFLTILLADRVMAFGRRILRRDAVWSQDATTRS
jgi:glycosyltransferase involved in cell wall biosynthesis